MANEAYKKKAAEAAVELVETGMTLGLGTGSTAAHFIAAVGAKFSGGGSIACVVTSEATRRAAQDAGLRVVEPDETTQLDLAVDGADEIGPDGALIKGGGGALMREKIVAQSAARFVVIADDTKLVRHLGAFALPVEIEPALFGLTVAAVRRALAACGYDRPNIALRRAADGTGPYLTDGGRYILDAALVRIDEPALLDDALRAIAGVTETGLFVGLATDCIVAGPKGVRRIPVKTP
ncbi:MAG: ribose-5-phosphate isomerase RpiA [Alphaproteobacteria bacterium]|nr:ribose-5-phosphate isomerase RpiA [Alphaproteobacteria bacterium]